MHAQIRLILANSNEAKQCVAARREDEPAPFPGRRFADLRSALSLSSDLRSAPATSFVSDSAVPHAEVTAYLSALPRVPVVLGEGVADASEDERVLALHQIYYDSPEEAERITQPPT